MSKTFATLFSGIGGADLGLTNAGFKPAYAVEWNQGAIDILTANHDIPIVKHADVRHVWYSLLPEVDLLWASPVCCNFSGAKHDAQENFDDMTTGETIARAARFARSAIIENVPKYYDSEAFKYLLEKLKEIGFRHYNTYRLNANRFGNPASRDRTYAIFSREFFNLELPKESRTNWADVLLANKQYWLKSKLTKNQQNAIDSDMSRPIPESIYSVERCGYYKHPSIYNGLSSYPCIKSHTHHDGKNAKPGHGKIGSYRSYMDFIYEDQSYSVTPQLLGVLNGFPIDYMWGENRAQAAAGIGNAVVPAIAEIIVKYLTS